MAERIDPEMLKNLDLLLAMDVLESESDWELAEDMESVEQERDSDEEKNDE